MLYLKLMLLAIQEVLINMVQVFKHRADAVF